MNEYILFIAGLFISVFGSAKDGLFRPYPYVGWIWRHVALWTPRDIPLILIMTQLNLWFMLILLFTRTFHSLLIRQIKYHITYFHGPDDPPEWWKQLRKLWSWALW